LRRRQSVPAKLVKWKPEIATKEKYGVTAHSRPAGKKIELNCNNNFV
jgi:hypothetical protein